MSEDITELKQQLSYAQTYMKKQEETILELFRNRLSSEIKIEAFTKAHESLTDENRNNFNLMTELSESLKAVTEEKKLLEAKSLNHEESYRNLKTLYSKSEQNIRILNEEIQKLNEQLHALKKENERVQEELNATYAELNSKTDTKPKRKRAIKGKPQESVNDDDIVFDGSTF